MTGKTVAPQRYYSEEEAISDYGWDPDISECTTLYQPGGYHFVQINDLLNERYRVLYKLGFGSYSTTWLARDETTQRLVAVKVCVSDPIISHEADTLRTLATAFAAQDTRRTKWIPMVLDSFEVQGPNGRHPCYVRAPAKAKIISPQGGKPNNANVFELDIARSLAAQVALAIAFLHTQGYVHGDLQALNVLIQFPEKYFELSNDQLHRTYGKPAIEPVVCKNGPPAPGIPPHLTIQTFLGRYDHGLGPYPARIMLSDFGEAFQPAQESKPYSNVSIQYRAPENVFNDEDSLPLSFPSDIWSLGCILWKLFCRYPLFCVWNGSQDLLIHEIIGRLGMLPPDWWQKWKMRSYWYNEDYTLHSDAFPSLEQAFEKESQEYRVKYDLELIAQDEKEALLSLLRRMLALKPENRITADEVLKSEWMVKWALPAFEEDPTLPY